MEKIVIIGAGGHGRVILDILRAANQYNPIGFIDGNTALHDHRIDGLKVLGNLTMLETLKFEGVTGAIVAIGNNGIRREYAERIDELGLELINAIHPSANIAANATLGKNIVIASGALVCAHCQIGNSAILNTGCIVDHESIIANAAHICPGAKLAGRVIVEGGAFVGIGATIIQNIRIGTGAVVGAGAVVINDVPPAATVVGVPAKIIKSPLSPKFTPNKLEEYFQEVTI
jgi:sugar O-acyltransferase (sialic acid O-acetyltransferase NeuD family)